MSDVPEVSETPSTAQTLGAYMQGILLGIPLFFALIKLLALAEGVSIFRYQAF